MKLNFSTRLFSHIPPLETKRLILRDMRRSDAKDMFEYSSNPKTTKFLLWDVHEDIDYTRLFINSIISKYKTGEYNDWALVYKENGKMIGTCGFTRIDTENRVAEVGYVINPSYWNMGLATEAVSKIIEFAFETLGVHRVEAKFMFGNDASLAVMKKVGMKFEGYQRDALYVKGKYRTIGISSVLKNEFYK